MTPEQQIAQRNEAMKLANEMRLRIAAQRRHIASLPRAQGRLALAGLIEDGSVDAWPIGRALCAIHTIGRGTVGPILNMARIRSADRRLRDLSDRQRALIVTWLRDNQPHANGGGS